MLLCAFHSVTYKAMVLSIRTIYAYTHNLYTRDILPPVYTVENIAIQLVKYRLPVVNDWRVVALKLQRFISVRYIGLVIFHGLHCLN